MIKSLIKNIALIIGGAFVVDGIGSYQLFPNIPEVNAMGVTFCALLIMMLGLMGLFYDIYRVIRYVFHS